MTNSDAERYARQTQLAEIGTEGQARLAGSSVLVVGCGALGSAIAALLARAGVGRLRIVDRDVVEIHNLHRQLLFDERDVAECQPKAQAAARRLGQINSSIEVEAGVLDVAPANVESLVAEVDLVLDGTDNIETRYLLNDACLEHGKTWIYGGAVGTSGMTLDLFVGHGPCLRCIFREPPPPASLPTCDTAGVLGTLPAIIAAMQATEAIKILTGSRAVSRDLVIYDAWHGTFDRVAVTRAQDCPACRHGERDFLHEADTTRTTRLCGRNAVQLDPPQDLAISLDLLRDHLAKVVKVDYNGHLVRLWVGEIEIIVFADGRAIVRGTTDPTVARRLYAQYVGM